MIGTLKSPWAGEEALRALARLVALDISCVPLVALLDEFLRFVEHLTPDMRCSILIADLSSGVPRCGAPMPGMDGFQAIKTNESDSYLAKTTYISVHRICRRIASKR
jgi:hypothetical protein